MQQFQVPKTCGPDTPDQGVSKNTFWAIIYNSTFNNALFFVVVADPEEPAGEALLPVDYDFEASIEGKILDEIMTPAYTGLDRGNRQNERQAAGCMSS